MSKKQPFAKYHKLSIYMGYGDHGYSIRERVTAAIKSSGMSARDILLTALNLKISDGKK